jgi:hypothetical protein
MMSQEILILGSGEDLQYDPRSRCPSTPQNADRIADVCEMVIRDRRWALRMMVNELNINKKTIHPMLHV